MKCVIEIKGRFVRIVATVEKKDINWDSDELIAAKNVLADRLMRSLEDLPFSYGTRLSKQKVKA